VLAHDDYGVPLLLTRDADGRFRAFLNVCRHRGMRLVAASGKAEPRASVVCPYHGWTYKLDGALRHRLHAEAFDDCPAADTNLVALPCEERHGLLWVVPTPEATIDVAAWLDGLDAELPFFGIEKLRHFRTIRAEYPANWKLIVDAFLEAYHIRVLHKETIYPFFADGMTAGDRFGPHIQSLVARRAGEEWARGEGSAAPEDMAALCALATPSQVIFPNTVTIFHPDYLSLITLYPVAAGTLRWTHRMLIPSDRTTPDWTPHWEKTFRLIEEGVFQKEDIACAIGIQQGFASGANAHLTAGRAEQGVGWFHADVARALAPASTARLSRA
jgi:phenylpropionate dioxygenase-like ring-hydroxylating dioxygenase large terminal subunit